MLEDAAIPADFRGTRAVAEIYAAAGIAPAKFAAAYDAWLTRAAASRDRGLHHAPTPQEQSSSFDHSRSTLRPGADQALD